MLHTTQAAFTLPATRADKAQGARADFISSTEPANAAARAYAAEDAREIAAMATAVRSFVYAQVERIRAMSYARAEGADLALMGECITEQIGEVLTPEAARYFDAELRAQGGVGA